MSDVLNAATFTSTKAQASKTIGELFSDLMLVQSENNDILGQVEGPEASNRPICRKDDLSKGRADTVNFTTIGRLGQPGVRGENELMGNEEIADFATYKVKLDYQR